MTGTVHGSPAGGTVGGQAASAALAGRALGAPLRGEYDVAVIGGGISGVQIARHAAGRGLRTVLLEKVDFGAGTSSATTKAIHGGLRYLEQYDFGVVAESVAERRFLAIAAPHLVQPRSFLLTAFDWSAPKAPMLGAGVALYEAFAWNRNTGVPRDIRSPRFRWVGRRNLLRRAPILSPDGLTGAWRHDDTLNLHPERLLLALVHSFTADGGTALNHAEVTGLLRGADGSGAVTGVRVRDSLTGETAAVPARTVINAAGPWVQQALGGDAPQAGVRVQQAKGVHLLARDMGLTDSLYVRGRNGRHVVVSPWQGRTLIGPTDTPSAGSADDARTEVEDVQLLRETLDSISARPLRREDVTSTIVGVRPLVATNGDTYSTSRRFTITDHAQQGLDGLFTVTGGKWTTGRAMGAQVIDRVIAARGSRLGPTRRFDSRRLPLSTSFGDYGTVAAAFDAALRRVPAAPVPQAVRLHLARLYGTAHERVLALAEADPRLAEPIGSGPDIAAQVVYAVTDEGARTLADVLERRLVIGTLGPVPEGALWQAAALLAGLLGWDEAGIRAEVEAYRGRLDADRDVLDEAFAR
ncbi:glycerol-3-phosphate dehydrogenase/oxidase [Helcobacillus sp. ACRRO]|uniref:glycerol-3-phosphate dehydrogenase/oxidase n=1 Tax=Helcobacillus sp. ACRRO TaxID=2918202 RepID=UPI001EF6FAF7|nr:glycerol-3-phosphate dehydrogenase/oxidase [Helcobacillus sp. ACRRO]MCG7427924.1 glycerol-3-phosphate dehydrogenase/oxidase [Helcobacillus sp. ACRRO]